MLGNKILKLNIVKSVTFWGEIKSNNSMCNMFIEKLISFVQKREDEIASLKRENDRLTKAKDNLTRKLKSLEDSKLEVDKDKDILKTNIGSLEKGELIPEKPYN